MRKATFAGLAALWIGGVGAAQQFGVEVYPGAKAAPEVSKMLKESLQVEAGTFTTGDPVAKVAAFYQKQPGLKAAPGADKDSAMFTAKGRTITVRNPWMDMKTGKLNRDTLVTIAKQ